MPPTGDEPNRSRGFIKGWLVGGMPQPRRGSHYEQANTKDKPEPGRLDRPTQGTVT
jgi:hypothetical protein